MPTVKGCPKCISIHSGGFPGRGAAKCKGCGGELIEVRYEITLLVWTGLGIFILASLLALYPVFIGMGDMTPAAATAYWSVEMAMEILGLLLFIIGTREARKDILYKLAEAGRQ